MDISPGEFNSGLGHLSRAFIIIYFKTMSLRYICKACNKKTTLDNLVEVGISHNNRPVRICKPDYHGGYAYRCNKPKWEEMYKNRLIKKTVR